LDGGFRGDQLLDLSVERLAAGPEPFEVLPARPEHAETGDNMLWLGDRFRIRYANRSASTGLAVSVLYLSSDGGIYSLNDAERDQVVPPGKEIILDPAGSAGRPCGTDYLKVFITDGTPFDPRPYLQKGSYFSGPPKTRGAEVRWTVVTVPLRISGDPSGAGLQCGNPARG
jgi:hypothetical protein